MTHRGREILFFTTVCLLTCFGVFVLPFLLPPPPLAGVSVANAAGFNNKVAAVATAFCATAVFLFSVWKRSPVPPPEEPVRPQRTIGWGIWLTAALVVGAIAGFLGWMVKISGLRHGGDAGYFVNQISSYTLDHRQLYTEIEFPYGPLLFYPPALLHSMLAGWHVSVQTCFFVVLVMVQVVGILLLGYVVNFLPMSRGWKILALCCFVPFTLQPVLALNYTVFRFIVPTACLIFCARRNDAWLAAGLCGLGTMLTLGVSPEIGFAFGAGAVAFALLQVRLRGRAWWAVAAMVPVAAAVFLLLVGRSYLRMLGLFAGGVFNFIVEPLPFVLIFLLAAVWLVPRMLAAEFRRDEQQATVLGACFVVSMALLPVAFGRADAGHVIFNGIGIFLLSFVAMTTRRRWKLVWAVSVVYVGLTFYLMDFRFSRVEVRDLVHRAALAYPDSWPSRGLFRLQARVKPWHAKWYVDPGALPPLRFDVDALAKIVGGDTVATPYVVPAGVEEELRERGLYRPDFYFFMIAVLDEKAEDRKIAAFNEARWAMLPDVPPYRESETQREANFVLQMALPYKAKRAEYVVGGRFSDNLHANWREVGRVDGYVVYCNLRNNARCYGR
jgi:hypothetical protein